ncbi:MAG: MFS transporter [Hyphomicrobiaceae bacterium]
MIRLAQRELITLSYPLSTLSQNLQRNGRRIDLIGRTHRTSERFSIDRPGTARKTRPAMSTPAGTAWRRGTLLAIILLGTLVGPLDSAVNIAFPDITTSFAIELKSIRWVVIAYVATYASLMLVFGRIGDLFGHARVFGVGLIVCSIAFATCSLATDYHWLLTARVFQGIGTAMVLSCGPALATNLFDEKHRPRILGLYAMTFGLGGAVGPSLGGILVDIWGWPAVFWSRLPLAVAALLLMRLLSLPSPERDRGRFDWGGAIALSATTVLFLISISQIEQLVSHPLRSLTLVALTLIAAIAFIVLSQRTASPILDLKAFKQIPFAWINLANIVVNFAGFATMLFVPYYLVQASALPLWQGGIIMAIGPLGMMFASNVGGRTMHALGANRIALSGAVCVAFGLAWMSFWDATTSRLVLACALLVHGTGLGLFQVASLERVAAVLPKSNRGVAGSLTMVMRTIGVVMAANILTTAFAHVEQSATLANGNDAFILAFQSVFQWSAVGLAAFVALSILCPGLWQRSER